MSRWIACTAVLLLASTLGACGQKGPLTLTAPAPETGPGEPGSEEEQGEQEAQSSPDE